MKKPTRRLAVTLITAAMCAAGSAHATNGYFTHGIGTKNKGMAGAGIALPQDAIDTVNNPAVATKVGNNMQLGAALFSPDRSYRTSESQLNGQFGAFTIGPNNLTSDKELFIIPHFSRVWQKPNDTAFAMSFYGRGGMNTTWKGGTATFDPDGPGPAPVMTLPGTFGAGKAGVDLSQAFLDITWANEITENTSIGIAAVLSIQMFEANGLMTFAPYTETFASSGGMSMPTKLTNNGHDLSYGGGFKFGLHSELTERLSFGAMYTTPMWMTEFDDYSDLFAESGGFDIPGYLKLGLTWEAVENLYWSFDIEHTWFSDVDSVGTPISTLFMCPTAGAGGMDLSSCLGGSNGAGFGWDDMTTYKFGVQWNSGTDWTWRAGYSHGSQPIPTSEMLFNILAPAVVEDHWSFGFTKLSGENKNREWNFAFTYVPSNSQTGLNTFDPTQTITWEMDQMELEVSYGWRF
jgi:long-chain fatty acid transport protein